ncbi:hypothetical protein [Kosakonia sacchari]|uniref:Uncharacterized protein n=1 Tax=Kosakonia sacchari TaxID=1158459 RepID=A0ABZ0MWR7_9ENTR|nr:hypothetical protein [Kosakonia sacchari]WOZ79963.1 hypothetical protein Q8Y70_23680 [Kosakonia sacchari]
MFAQAITMLYGRLKWSIEGFLQAIAALLAFTQKVSFSYFEKINAFFVSEAEVREVNL